MHRLDQLSTLDVGRSTRRVCRGLLQHCAALPWQQEDIPRAARPRAPDLLHAAAHLTGVALGVALGVPLAWLLLRRLLGGIARPAAGLLCLALAGRALLGLLRLLLLPTVLLVLQLLHRGLEGLQVAQPSSRFMLDR